MYMLRQHVQDLCRSCRAVEDVLQVCFELNREEEVCAGKIRYVLSLSRHKMLDMCTGQGFY